jgi:hypothetical protein
MRLHLLKTLVKFGPQPNKHLLLVVVLLYYLLLMVQVTGSTKHGLEQKMVKMIFLPIKLPWYVHPERDQTWREKQDEF